MRKIVLIFIMIVSVAQAQDTSRWNKATNYGMIYDRLKAGKVLLLPSDTVNNKYGAAIVNNQFYIGNGSKWSLVTGGGGSTDTTTRFGGITSLYKHYRDSLTLAAATNAKPTYGDVRGIVSDSAKTMTLQRVTDNGNVTNRSVYFEDSVVGHNWYIHRDGYFSGAAYYADYAGTATNATNANMLGNNWIVDNNNLSSNGNVAGINTPNWNIGIDGSGTFPNLSWDLNGFLSAKNLKITGTNGDGKVELRHQASDATASGQTTALFANGSGYLKWKNDGNYYTTLATPQSANRVYTFQDKSYTLADSATVLSKSDSSIFQPKFRSDTARTNIYSAIAARVKYTDTAAMLNGRINSITLNNTGILHNTPLNFVNSGGSWVGTQTLATQSANKIFGTGNTSSTPTFRSIDSSYFGGNFNTQVRSASILDSSKFVGTTRNNDTINGAKVLTGLVSVRGATPELRMTTTDNLYARLQRSTTNNTFTAKNNVLQQGGKGNSVVFTGGSAQYITSSDANIPTSNNNISISVWFKSTSSSRCILSLAGGWYLWVYNSNQILLYNRAATAYANIQSNYADGNWHNYIITATKTGASTNTYTAYFDGVAQSLVINGNPLTGGSPTGTLLIGARSTTAGDFNFNGSLDQVLIYNTVLSAGDVATIWASGGGTSTPPTTGLIRQYDFETGIGTTAFDTNPNVTASNGTFNSTVAWGGLTTGAVPISASTSEGTFLSYIDGINASERGQLAVGDIYSGTILQGVSVKTFLNALTYPFIQDGTGKVLISPTNSSSSATALSSLSVVGNQSIGTNAAAPSNGLTVSGNTLLGSTTDNLLDRLQVTSGLKTDGFKASYVAKTANYSATATDYLINVTATGVTITLPTAVGISGKIFVIKNTFNGTAAIATTSSQTIDGSTTYSLSAQYKYITVMSDGANWIIISNN